ncbi:MAG: TolC family protein [Burkholderiaceae bacterium]|nr:TolC family protein [Burkholderiaceae bacterium]
MIHRVPSPVATAAAASLLLALALPCRAACVDEEKYESSVAAGASPEAKAGARASGMPELTPLEQMRSLVRDALARNHGVGAARLLAEAAISDADEARANKKPIASVTGSLTPSVTGGGGSTDSQIQGRAGITLSQTLFDGGRSDRMIDWRSQQADAARFGQLSTEEQIALSTVSLAFERSRYRMQTQVYGQYVRKMSCLVEALETIVNADRGRTSELVQVKKQLQQAELQQVTAASQARQVEVKLRRLVGDGLPTTQGMAALLLTVPELPDVLTSAERASDIAQLDANAGALRALARMAEASTKPQVSWNVGAGANLAAAGGSGGPASTHSANLSAGITVSIPLIAPGVDHSIQAARKRAEAAALQAADALETRRARIAETHEQAQSAMDRVRRTGLVLRDSDKVRNFTLQQWQQLGRRSLFDVIGSESDHYNLRVAYVNALHDGQQMNATLQSLGKGLLEWLK